jgi:hypothetical protein
VTIKTRVDKLERRQVIGQVNVANMLNALKAGTLQPTFKSKAELDNIIATSKDPKAIDVCIAMLRTGS